MVPLVDYLVIIEHKKDPGGVGVTLVKLV